MPSRRNLWESEEALWTRFASAAMREALDRAGVPAMTEAEQTIVHVHAAELPI